MTGIVDALGDLTSGTLLLTKETTQAWPFVQPLFAAGGYFPDGLTITATKLRASSATEATVSGTTLIDSASLAVEAKFSGSGDAVNLDLSLSVSLAKLTGDGSSLRIEAEWKPQLTFRSNGGHRTVELHATRGVMHIGSLELTASFEMSDPEIMPRLRPGSREFLDGAWLSATMPGPQFVATLRRERQQPSAVTRPKLSAVTRPHALGEVGEGLSLEEVRLTADPWRGHYSIALDAGGDWEILRGFHLTGISAFLFYASEGGITSARLHADVRLGSDPLQVELQVEATYDPAVSGWQFEGGLAPDEMLDVAKFVPAVLKQLGIEGECPASLRGALIKGLSVAFGTATRNLGIRCEMVLPLDVGRALDITLDIYVEGSSTSFHGTVTLGSLVFDLVLDETAGNKTLLASYTDATPRKVKLGDLLATFLDETEASNRTVIARGNDVAIDVKEAFFAYESRGSAPAVWLLAADVEAGIDLSGLPVVGASFPPGQGARLLFQPLVTSGGIGSTGLEKLVQGGSLTLPSPLPATAGFSVTTRVSLAMEEIKLGLPVRMSDGRMEHAPGIDTGPPPPEVTSVDNVSWMAAQKSYGPLALERLGLRFDDGYLHLLLDAHLTAAGLTLALQGFGAKVKIADPSDVTPTLDGMAIDFRAPGLEIGGSLVHQRGGVGKDAYDEYVGTAIVKAGLLTIDAIGAYQTVGGTVGGHPSLFLYAALDYPIGGPAFFFVTGLAAAFGYNRAFKLPPIEKLASFPLLADNVGQGDARSDEGLRAASKALREYIPAELGAVFLGVGLKFDSFKTITSRALLTASFGKEVAIDLIGRSTLIMPAGATRDEAVAVVEMAWLASFRPEEGLLALRAQLSPGSFVFAHDCHLSGGFAFYSWFKGEHEGEFVITAGGYHPAFDLANRPHFPRVPRLAVAWEVKDTPLTIKGDAYYALTSSAAMLGGHLEMVWEQNPYKAWFKAGIDCLFEWKPLHYKGEAYVELGASYTFEFAGTRHITVEVGADLTVWGPPFSGRARVNLVLFSFDVAFGSATAEAPPVRLFDDGEGKGGGGFSALLPAVDKLCAVSVAGGLSRTAEDGKVWVVNPKTLRLIVDNVVPSKLIVVTDMTRDQEDRTGDTPARFGIRPMAAGHDDVTSETTITITKRGYALWKPHDLSYRQRTKGFPAALWGEPKTAKTRLPAKASEEKLIEALAGVEIVPNGVPDTGKDNIWNGTKVFERHRPALRDGIYDIVVAQTLHATSAAAGHGTACSKPLEAKASLCFEVAGDKTSLPASVVHSVFPPQGSLGDHATSLPQIILERSTLPWEQEMKDADKNTPWLALLVFDGEMKAVPEGPKGPSRITVEATEIPTAAELKKLCHVRVARDAERAVVVAKRAPTAGKLSTAHLVSLRDVKVDGAKRHLISLWSWSFSCLAGGAGFRSLVENLAKACILGTTERLGHALPDGQRGVADYRGPLVPMSGQAGGRSAGRIATSGRTDISHVAALELGRLLALENKSVSVGLLRLKRSLAHAERHEGQVRAAAYLHVRRPPAATTGAAPAGRLLPAGLGRLLTPELAAWTEGLLKLEGVPFRYLLPDERQLPKESLLSFALDERWLTNLLVGALGVGGAWRLGETPGAELPGFKHALRAGGGPVGEGERPFGALPRLTGIVLRSQLVSGWPAMSVVADGQVAPLVSRRCSKNILLVLFQGAIRTVSFRLLPETLHFEASDQGKPGESVPADWLTQPTSSVDLRPWFDLAKQEEVAFAI
ncbi:DUF6603 domain-containing protein [Falsiroseomonas sp. E2-1-a4]|uniref:DUF6603 domain-containing protein n=1 Tax=Falsiroseomonas sp. E2-1-a4 TaxID=3239299 RepID=UPI003F3EE13C